MGLLRQNSELKADNIWNWTLPAWVTKLPDGRVVNVCPRAGACKNLCYARNGTFRFRNVLAAHQRNLMMTLDNLLDWKQSMLVELAHNRFRPTGKARLTDMRDQLVTDPWALMWLDAGGAAVRIHDSGDFYSDEYLNAWIEIAEAVPDVLFYAYTKEVSRLRFAIAAREAANGWPPNLRIIFSLGGTEDYLLDLDQDRHAEVFPDMDSLVEAGYTDQTANDLLAVLLDTPRIGIPANNIASYRKRMGRKTFGSIEAEQDRNAKARTR